MRQYHDLLRHLLTYGRWSGNRTGIDTKKDFGYSMYFNLSNGEFPLVTTKKLHIPSIVHELIWFLRGGTNTDYLNAHGVRIWDEWALAENHTVGEPLHFNERVQLYAQVKQISDDAAFDAMHRISLEHGHQGALVELQAAGIPMNLDRVVTPAGALGPVYGHQWRSWGTGATNPDGTEITVDQVSHVIKQLRENPNSRRILISAWNVKDLPDESMSPQDNVRDGKMALAPCHVMFQFGTLPMNTYERCMVLLDRFEAKRAENPDLQLDDSVRAYYEYTIEKRVTEEQMVAYLDEQGIPKYMLNCHLYQRSADCFLGVPFNIASYALLTCMMAQVVNMVPGKLIHSLGDFHIYQNHMDQVEEQLTRQPYPMPRLKLNPNIKELTDFTAEDIEFVDYQYHPAIKGKVAV